MHNSFHNLQKHNVGLVITLDPTHEYLFCTDPTEATPNTIRVFRTKYNYTSARYDHSIIGEPITTFKTSGNPQTFTNEMISKVTCLLQSFDLSLNDFNSKRARVGFVRMEYTQGGTVVHENFGVNTWTLMFSNFRSGGTLSELLNKDQFKHGLFAQFPVNGQYDNSQYAESSYYDDDTTMAVDWHPEMVVLTVSPVKAQNLNPAEVAASQGYALSLLNKVETAANRYVNSEVLRSIIEKYEQLVRNTIDLDDTQIQTLTVNLITEINNNIRTTATDVFSILRLAEDNNTIELVVDENWKNYVFKNIIEANSASIGEGLNRVREYSPNAPFDVIMATDTETNEPVYFVFYQDKSGTLNVS